MSSRKRLQRRIARLRTKAIPTEALSRISSCSAAARCARSSARRRSVTSSTIQTVPRWVFPASSALAIMRHRNVEPSLRRSSHSRSSCRPAERIGTAIWPSAALLGAQRAVEIEQQGEVLLPRRLARGGVGGVAPLVEVRGALGQPLLRLPGADHGEQLALQPLPVAVAHLVVERRALRELPDPLDLGLGQPSHPVLQSLHRARRASLPSLGLAATQVLARELAVVLGEPLLHVPDLLRAEAIEHWGDPFGSRTQAFARLRHQGIVPPNDVLAREAAAEAARRFFAEARVLRQRRGAVPVVECIDALVELRGLLAMDIEIISRAPAQPRIGVVVGQPDRAAAGEQRQRDENHAQPQGDAHQKLSTLIWPGLRRRCLRRPRSTSAAVASFSMSGFPHSNTWDDSGAILTPAACSSRPSRTAAGMRPDNDPGWGSLLTKLT